MDHINSEQRATNEEPPRSIEQFRVALEAVPVGMLIVDVHGAIVMANAQVERLFGFERGELMGAVLETLIPERYRGHHASYRRGFLRDPRARPMGEGRDLYGRRKDGTEIPVEIGLNPLATLEGTFVLASIVDLSERKRSMEQFRLALEAAPTGMMMVDGSGKIVLVNAQIERLFGYPREELIGQQLEMLVPVRFRVHHPTFRHVFTSLPRARPMGAGRDLYGLRKDGTEIPIEIGLNPLSTEAGNLVLSSVADITARKQAESENQELMEELQQLNISLEARVAERTQELTTAVREREVLLQEIHHRVKNNLQVISSLINMKLRRLEQGVSRDALEHCQTRIQAIALIHEKLYQSQDYGRVPFSDYARSLAASVLLAAGVSPHTVSLELAVEDLTIAVDKAIPCGLILNELITNAMKHAFQDGRPGIIRVELGHTDDGSVFLGVQDNGIGLLSGFEPKTTDTLGLQLVCTLAEQLEAKLEIRGDAGTMFRLTFAVN